MQPKTIPYAHIRYSEAETIQRSTDHYQYVNSRRTVREFSPDPIPEQVIQHIVLAASTAPSGANKQPWVFCVITDHAIKSRIREAAEKEEYESYHGRMTREWLDDLAHLGTDWHKPFLETAPVLIAVFRKSFNLDQGVKTQNYYVQESVGIACGFLLEAIHYCGLVALTHTPSPMNFLAEILNRPQNEKPFLLIPVGYPAPGTTVPDIRRKPLEEVYVHY